MATSTSSHDEVERKFTVDDTRLLDLSAVRGVTSVREDSAVALRATYFDTSDLRLSRLAIELRRRTGGQDAGWHLKVPVGPDRRVEIRVPLDARGNDVPEQLRGALLGLSRERPLLPVAVVETSRRERHLIGPEQKDLAVVALDEVEARRLVPAPASPTSWNEVEVELVDGPPETMERTAKVLRRAGAEPSRWQSKVGRALNEPGPDRKAAKPHNAGDVVLRALRRHVAALQTWDVGVRTNQPDAVHEMRVATRRLRSNLATFRPLLAGERWEAMRGELKWIGGLLGAVRDLDVLEDRLLAEIDEQESLLVIGPVRARTRRELRAQRRDARDRLDDAMRSDRYLRLLAELSALLADPPLTERAHRKPTRVGRDVERSVRRVQKAVRRADKAAEPRERDTDLHDIRKAAKRARYAAEVALPVYGKDARRLARTMENAQEVLGEHQDAVTARPALRDLGVKAYLAGENGFTFGLLSRAEQVRAEQARARYRNLRPRLRRTRPRLH